MSLIPGETAYREPSHPAPRVFPLGLASDIKFSVLGMVVSVLASVAAVVLTSCLVVAFVGAGVAPLLNALSSGVPRALEIHHDHVVIRYVLRTPIEFRASELRIRESADTLAFESEHGHAEVDLTSLRLAHRAACIEALREVAADRGVLDGGTDS